MANLLLEVMRDRMMVDRGLVENVYLPWLMSVMNGNMKPGALLNQKKDLSPTAYSFTKEAFAIRWPVSGNGNGWSFCGICSCYSHHW